MLRQVAGRYAIFGRQACRKHMRESIAGTLYSAGKRAGSICVRVSRVRYIWPASVQEAYACRKHMRAGSICAACSQALLRRHGQAARNIPEYLP